MFLHNTGEQQKVLPGFEKIIPEEMRRFPQPHEELTGELRWYEILYHPLDLRFRGKLHKWLEVSQRERNFKLKDVLDGYYFKIVSLYLYPQPPGNKWLSQKDVIAIVSGDPKARFKRQLTISMVMIWKKVHGLNE